jgi:uncharacterized protein YkwD
MMKPIVRFAILVLALMMFATSALAECPKASNYSYTIDYFGTPYTVTCKDGKTTITPCDGSTATAGANVTAPTATKCPTTSVKGTSTCPNVTAKPTKKPAATAKPTKKPAATAKPTKKPAATAAPASGSSLSSMAASVVSQTNAERASAGLSKLTVSSELTRAACVRAQEIVSKFSHTRPDGSAWSTVSSSARGENIAMGQQSADKVMAAWMSSSGHRANILRSSFGSIGVCAYKVGNTMYWVQEFGG